jgi:ribosomal-protein-alanine N-acetyltransferase
MRMARATPVIAQRQADWIVAEEPWRGMGYQAGPLGRWLARLAKRGLVRVAVKRGAVMGIIVTQPEVLLGHFIALLAVAPWAQGRGLGRALVDDAAVKAFREGRWLYTSSDQSNRVAAAFYRKLGFRKVGRLPDLVRDGRTEILWRRGREGAVSDKS